VPGIAAGLSPQLTGNCDRIDAGVLPPGGFVAHAMHQPVMDAAERDHEFVARFAAERSRLQIAQVMRIRWLAAADQARLLGDMAKVIAAWSSDREHAMRRRWVEA